MAIKRATRKKKESDITEEFEQSYKQKFDCSNIKLRKQFPLTHNQTSFYYKSQEEKTSMLLLDGVAGTAKTYIAVYTALELLWRVHLNLLEHCPVNWKISLVHIPCH